MREKPKAFDYDVALSFAGEDRKYVHEVASVLLQIGIKVFYDDYERVDLWGKNLFTHLDDVYQKKSQFCVMFLSRHYKRKLWTNHERESAQTRAFQTRKEYILTARFDDTKVPGIRATRGYIDLRTIEPAEFAYLIARKIGKWGEIDEMLLYLRRELTADYEISVDGTEINFKCAIEQYEGSFPLRLLLEMYRTGQLWNMFIAPGIVPI